MKNQSSPPTSIVLLVALFTISVLVAGCDGCDSGSSTYASRHHRKREVGRVYTSANGNLYVRAHEKKHTAYNNTDADDFIFWMSSDGGGSWNPTSSVPTDLSASRRVVSESMGRPTGKVEEEELNEEEVVDEQTTEAEAETADAETGADADAGSSDAGSSDSGSDGGSDGGGGDD